MKTKPLEQILDYAPRVEVGKLYQKIDFYNTIYEKVIPLYTGKLSELPKFNPIGSQGSGYSPGGIGNIRRDIFKSDDIIIQERFFKKDLILAVITEVSHIIT